MATALAKAAREVRLGRGALFLMHIALTVLGVYVLGHKMAIPLSLGLYVVVWGRYRWWAGLGAARWRGVARRNLRESFGRGDLRGEEDGASGLIIGTTP